jgi:hypothetical protein
VNERRDGEVESQVPDVEHQTLNINPPASESHSGPHRFKAE